MSVELFIKTREDLRPDPALDAIGAIFVCVHYTGSQKSFQGFCLFVADELAKPLAREHSLGNNFSQNCVDIAADSELILLEKFEQLVHQQDPDILVGFEMEMLSWGYLFDRADQLSYDLHTRCSRISNDRKRRRSFHTYSYISADVLSVTGRISINLWMLMRDAVTLRMYTFENVAFHVLRLRTPFYSFRQLTQWFMSALNRWRVIEYYMLRTRANVELLVERDVVNRTAELARLIGIQFLEVLTRGSQFRIESMMLRMTKSAGYVAMSPTVEQRARMAAPECLALTLEPESNFFSYPVIVLDFQSLYPSICIAYNYCYSTCLGKVSNISGDGRMSFGCAHIPIRLEALKQLRSNITASPAGVLFVNSDVRRGILPQMLEEILNTRIMVKKCAKEYADEKDLLKVLDARQWGLKMIANLTYGYTAANFSGRMPCVEVADSIVQKGRETLENAIKMVNENPSWDAKVVYGDTDSMFVSVPDRSKEDAFRIGFEIAEKVTEMNPYPVKLKFEKVYLPCVLQTKKRYVGYAYESLEQKDPIFDAKGIETVRRDSCPLVSDTLENALKLLFDTNDVDVVERYLTKIFEKVLCDSISTEQFIFAKEYRGKHSYTENAPVPALAIARERLSKDRRSEPRVGERVPYVIVCGPPDTTLISCVREPQQLIQDSSVRLNHAYYILRQLVPVINRVLIMFSRDANDLLSRFSNSLAIKQRKKRRKVFYEMEKTEQMSMSQFVKVNRCRVCWEVMSGGSFCADCLQRKRESYLTLEGRLRSSEERLMKAIQMCRLCSEYTHSPDSSSVGCCSLSCPVYFQRLRLVNTFLTALSDFNNFV